MKNKLSIVFACVLLFLVISPSFAVESSESAQTNTTTATKSSRLKPALPLKERKEPIKMIIQTNREEFKERIASSQALFKEKLNLIKDERKQDILESMNERIQTINTNKTDKFAQVLERLSNILETFKQKEVTASSEGQNTQELEKQITEAETAITLSESAVASQAATDYTLTIEDEDTLRQTVGQTVSDFKKDLVNTFKTVMNARKEVVDAARELAKLRVVVDITATESAE